jgi:hypothetical protein
VVALLVVGPAVLDRNGPGVKGSGLKGSAVELVELSAAVVARDGDVRRLMSGDFGRPGEVVVLRYRASAETSAVLIQQVNGGVLEQLGTFELSPGVHDLALGPDAAGVRLERGWHEVRWALVPRDAREPYAWFDVRVDSGENGR